MNIPEPKPAFEYWNGAKKIYADPLPIFRAILIRTRGKPNELANKVYNTPPDTQDVDKLVECAEAMDQLIAMVRDIFQMVPFDPSTGQGAQDGLCWAVWEAFCGHMNESKKNTVTLPTPSSPTASAETSSQPTSSTSV